MIVNCTRHQWERLADMAFDATNSIELLDEFEHCAGGDQPGCRIVAEIPYSAGILLRDLLIDHCYTDRKTMRRGLSKMWFTLLKTLTHATNEETRHPALRGIGMEGHIARVFHVWQLGPDDYTPYPNVSARFLALRPVWHLDDRFPSTKVTMWSPDGGLAPASRLDNEWLHWRFTPTGVQPTSCEDLCMVKCIGACGT